MALVFVSYARENQEFVLRLVNDLRRRGVPVWLDQHDIPAGKRWDVAVEQALYVCSHFLLVMSSASVMSENVRDELDVALDEDKAIVPVLIEDCRAPLRVRRMQYTDFTQHDYGQALSQLVASLPVSEDARPGDDGSTSIVCSLMDLQEAIGMVSPAAAQSNERPVLTGIMLYYDGQSVVLAATDGYRMAEKTIPAELGAALSGPVTLHRDSLKQLTQATGQGQIVSLSVLEEHSVAHFTIQDQTFTVPLLNAPYPAYRQAIPQDIASRAVVYRGELLAACERAAPFARQRANAIQLAFQVAHNKLVISVQNEHDHWLDYPILAETSGTMLELASNVRFLMDAVYPIKVDKVSLAASGVVNPMVVRPDGDDSYLHIIMPMQFSQ